MLKLSEWNELCEYAQNICNNFKEDNIDVRYKPYTAYTLYDRKKGIYFQVFDSNGEFYKKYNSGICDSFEEMKLSLNRMVLRIIKDCK